MSEVIFEFAPEVPNVDLEDKIVIRMQFFVSQAVVFLFHRTLSNPDFDPKSYLHYIIFIDANQNGIA